MAYLSRLCGFFTFVKIKKTECIDFCTKKVFEKC